MNNVNPSSENRGVFSHFHTIDGYNSSMHSGIELAKINTNNTITIHYDDFSSEEVTQRNNIPNCKFYVVIFYTE